MHVCSPRPAWDREARLETAKFRVAPSTVLSHKPALVDLGQKDSGKHYQETHVQEPGKHKCVPRNHWRNLSGSEASVCTAGLCLPACSHLGHNLKGDWSWL